MAHEGHPDGHGVLSYALLEGLRGAANRDKDKYIDIDEISKYVTGRVPEITLELWGFEQFPQRSLQGMSFPIASAQ